MTVGLSARLEAAELSLKAYSAHHSWFQLVVPRSEI